MPRLPLSERLDLEEPTGRDEFLLRGDGEDLATARLHGSFQQAIDRRSRLPEREGRVVRPEAMHEEQRRDGIARAIDAPGGRDAVNLRVAEQYVKEFGRLASTNNTMIIPASVGDVGGMVATLGRILQPQAGATPAAPPPLPGA